MISVGEGLIKTPGDVPGLARQSPRGLWKDEIENEISVEDAGVGQTRMARAPAIVRPETRRGPGFVDSRAVHHPIKAKKTGKGALDVKTLSKEARAGITVRLPFTRTALAAALLIGTGGENTRTQRVPSDTPATHRGPSEAYGVPRLNLEIGKLVVKTNIGTL